MRIALSALWMLVMLPFACADQQKGGSSPSTTSATISSLSALKTASAATQSSLPRSGNLPNNPFFYLTLAGSGPYLPAEEELSFPSSPSIPGPDGKISVHVAGPADRSPLIILRTEGKSEQSTCAAAVGYYCPGQIKVFPAVAMIWAPFNSSPKRSAPKILYFSKAGEVPNITWQGPFLHAQKIGTGQPQYTVTYPGNQIRLYVLAPSEPTPRFIRWSMEGCGNPVENADAEILPSCEGNFALPWSNAEFVLKVHGNGPAGKLKFRLVDQYGNPLQSVFNHAEIDVKYQEPTP